MTSLTVRPSSAFSALVRKDLGDARGLLLLVLLLDVVVLTIAHVGFTEQLETIQFAALPAALGLAVLSMVPVVAEIYASDTRTGVAGHLRGLPVRQVTFAGAKLSASACVIAVSIAVSLVAQEVIYAIGAAADLERLPSDWLDWNGSLVRGTAAALGLALSLAVLIALVTRNALQATLGTLAGCGVLAGTVVVASRHVESTTWIYDILSMFVFSLTTPLGWTVVLGLIASLTVVRGRVARSATRRAAAALLAPVLMTVAGAAGLTVREIAREPMPFDAPDADLAYVHLSPDGTRVALQLQRIEDFAPRQSMWVLDTHSWTVEPLPQVVPSTRAWLPSAGMVSQGGWSSDGERVLGLHMTPSGYLRSCFSIDVQSGRRDRISHEELMSESEYAGAPMPRPVRSDLDGQLLRSVELVDGSTIEIDWGSNRVPARANHLLFHVAADRTLRRLDRRTGDVAVLPIEIPARSSLWVGPHGRHVVVRHRDKSAEMHDLETGRTRSVPAGAQHWSWDGTYFARYGFPHTAGDVGRWTIVSMEGDELFVPERRVESLIALEDGRWLGRDSRKDALYLFAADGALIRTLREGRADD